MKDKIPQRELFADSGHTLMAQRIIDEALGPGFYANFDEYPKNIGVMGDEGVLGHTVIINSDSGNPAKFLAENPDLLAGVSQRICNETGVASKVLFNITPETNQMAKSD